jgi:undecaprenyl-diphosphatase
MDLISAAILGLVQGLTEFLPVSSSGHLVLAQSLIPGFTQPGVLFDVVLHFGTLFAVLYYFWKKILTLNKKYLLFLAVGTLPAGLIGYLFQTQLEAMFGNVKWVGIELIITGVLNLLIDKLPNRANAISIKNSFFVGVAQAIAIIPGISRSGSTIFTGVAFGISKKEAAEFSFLLSVPAILGANLLQFITHASGNGDSLGFYLVGLTASFIVGLASIKLLFKFLKESKFKIFGIYAIAVGALVLII